MPGSQNNGGPAIEYLLKEVSYSTCDNRFFGQLEKEMLIPNKVNIHGRIRGITSIGDYKLRLEFPGEAVIGYFKQPLTNTVESARRILTYKLGDLVNYDDYWWYPLGSETEFYLPLHLLPPYPEFNPLNLDIECRPDIAVGLETYVTTRIRLDAQEGIDYLSLRLSTPGHGAPGISTAITEYSDDAITEPREFVVSPKKDFPFPRLSMRKGQSLEYSVKTRIQTEPSKMSFLRCETDVLTTKLLTLSESSSTGPPCGVSILNGEGQAVPVEKTVRSTVLQASAWIMYSPFSARQETPREAIVKATVH